MPSAPKQHRDAAALEPLVADDESLQSSEGRKPEYLIGWTLLAVGGMMWADHSLPKTWKYAWTQDNTPDWAKAVFLWAGLTASVTFIHACIAIETAIVAQNFTIRECRAARAVYRVAAACTAGGAFCGLLFAFISAAGMPPGMKLTALASDLVTVGTIVGLAAASPFFVSHTWKAISTMFFRARRKFLEVTVVLTVFDSWMVDKIIRLLPKTMVVLRYVISLI